jgi:hypothetical protein
MTTLPWKKFKTAIKLGVAAWLIGGTVVSSFANTNMNFAVALDLYSVLSGRTLLIHPAAYLQKPVVLSVDPTNNAEGIKALEKILADRGLVAIPDGGKFMQVVPQVMATNANPHSAKLADVKSDPTAVSALNFINAPFDQVCDFYGALAGKKLIRDGVCPAVSISIRASNGLSTPEALYALDVLLGWQGITIVNVDEKTAKVVWAR